MRLLYFLLSIYLLAVGIAGAQTGQDWKSRVGHRPGSWAKVTLANPLLAQYDAQYLKLDLKMSNDTSDISGSAILKGEVVDPSGMGSYAFELSEYLTIDSAFFNGARISVSRLDTDIFVVSPGSSILFGQRFTAQIFYHGTPPASNTFHSHGLINGRLKNGTKVTCTFVVPDLAKEWMPCKQDLNDKIDSVDLWITVPDTLTAGCNGVLQAVTPQPGARRRFEWSTKYPIDYYLISIAVAPYVRHDQTVHFTGSSDTMLIQHFMCDTSWSYPRYKAVLDSTSLMVEYFSTVFGRYPFWKEKYGHCTGPVLGGAMENQTMTTMSEITDATFVAHELGHQWWGDCVTFASWRDIWLAEGMADYASLLFVEHFQGPAAAQKQRREMFTTVTTKVGGSVYVDDTNSMARVFDTRLTYDKGAAVAYMLRAYAPDTATHFRALQDYQRIYGFKTATTADFQHVIETAYGRNLDTFFNQWIYGEGYPTFEVAWNQKGSDVFIRLDQTTSKPTSVACFSMPLKLKLISVTGDTVVETYISKASHSLHFSWTQQITQIVVDPFEEVINKTGDIFNDPTLSVSNSAWQDIIVFPNPASENWQLKKVPAGATVSLYDVAGRLVWKRSHAPETLNIPAASLAAGTYILRISNSKAIRSIDLEKK
jgi:aminopeptidase N